MIPKTFGIDYDNTYTADPEAFDAFIAMLKAHGHRVLIVTCRHGNGHDSVCLENRAEVKVPGCTVVFTDGISKQWYMVKRMGIRVDIWIDDEFKSIFEGK